jgi:hypothetical protein
MARRWLRKPRVKKRYDCTDRTIERMVKDGRLPPPHYQPGSRTPLWDEDELEENDRRATLERPARTKGSVADRAASAEAATP